MMAERSLEIERILDFVSTNRNSYASLAVCRRALDPGLEQVTRETVDELRNYLLQAPDAEIDAYYSVVM
jgi:hypothetical protein